MMNLFYILINRGYRLIFGGNYMLHAPLFLSSNDSLFNAQINFCDHCVSFLPPLQGKRVIDVGCGNGMMTRYILHRYKPAFIYGVDIVAAQIAMAKRDVGALIEEIAGSSGQSLPDNATGLLIRLENFTGLSSKFADNMPGSLQSDSQNNSSIKFSIDDGQQLATVQDNSFDIVICLESALHYFDKEKFLAQVKRVLKPGGYFLIADLLKRDRSLSGFVRKKFRLFNWSRDQYLNAFKQHQLELTTDQDLNDLLLLHFKKARRAIKKDIRTRKPLASFFLLLLARPFFGVYHYQLRRYFQYHLFVGRTV